MSQRKDDSNPYVKVERIGQGSFGEVYRGYDSRNNIPVAIKIIDLDAEEDIADIQNEIAFLSQCVSPYITRYYGSVVEKTKLWIIMDLATGGSLRDMLKGGPIEDGHIAIIAREVLFALSYLHKSGIVHRDIKAANILINENGELKLCDFGVSGSISGKSTKRNTFVGTPFWMAPEVLKRFQYDFKADIWSLGITLYELATGDPPFHKLDPLLALSNIQRDKSSMFQNKHISLELKDFILTCLTLDPDERPSTEKLLKSKYIKSSMKNSTLVLKEIVRKYERLKSQSSSYRPTSALKDTTIMSRRESQGWEFSISPRKIKEGSKFPARKDSKKYHNDSSMKDHPLVKMFQKNVTLDRSQSEKSLGKPVGASLLTKQLSFDDDSLPRKTKDPDFITSSSSFTKQLSFDDDSLPRRRHDMMDIASQSYSYPKKLSIDDDSLPRPGKGVGDEKVKINFDDEPLRNSVLPKAQTRIQRNLKTEDRDNESKTDFKRLTFSTGKDTLPHSELQNVKRNVSTPLKKAQHFLNDNKRDFSGDSNLTVRNIQARPTINTSDLENNAYSSIQSRNIKTLSTVSPFLAPLKGGHGQGELFHSEKMNQENESGALLETSTKANRSESAGSRRPKALDMDSANGESKLFFHSRSSSTLSSPSVEKEAVMRDIFNHQRTKSTDSFYARGALDKSEALASATQMDISMDQLSSPNIISSEYTCFPEEVGLLPPALDLVPGLLDPIFGPKKRTITRYADTTGITRQLQLSDEQTNSIQLEEEMRYLLQELCKEAVFLEDSLTLFLEG